MTSLQIVSALVGGGLSLIYFQVFRRAIMRAVESGRYGRGALVAGIALRQAALGALLVVLWRVGLNGPWLLGGLACGVLGHRILLVKGWPTNADMSAFTRSDEAPSVDPARR